MATLYNYVLNVLSLNIDISLALIFQAQFIVPAITKSCLTVCELSRFYMLFAKT